MALSQTGPMRYRKYPVLSDRLQLRLPPNITHQRKTIMNTLKNHEMQCLRQKYKNIFYFKITSLKLPTNRHYYSTR